MGLLIGLILHLGLHLGNKYYIYIYIYSESEQRIAERCRKTLDNIKNLIVDHLVSPKDAFNTVCIYIYY